MQLPLNQTQPNHHLNHGLLFGCEVRRAQHHLPPGGKREGEGQGECGEDEPRARTRPHGTHTHTTRHAHSTYTDLVPKHALAPCRRGVLGAGPGRVSGLAYALLRQATDLWEGKEAGKRQPRDARACVFVAHLTRYAWRAQPYSGWWFGPLRLTSAAGAAKGGRERCAASRCACGCDTKCEV
jgi:hypothetical protein